MLPAQPNRGLIDGLQCLRALAISKTPVGVREMANRMLMEPTKVHRLFVFTSKNNQSDQIAFFHSEFILEINVHGLQFLQNIPHPTK